MERTIWDEIASACEARRDCEKSGNVEWFEKWSDCLLALQDRLPHGGGFDDGTTIDIDNSGFSKIKLYTAFHHMPDIGVYDGWTNHTVTIRPMFGIGPDIKVSGKDRAGIKDYIAEVFGSL